MVDDSGTLHIGLSLHRPSSRLRDHAAHRARACGGRPSDHDGAIAVLRRAVELGVDLIDTADSYGPDVAEELIREALHPYPDAPPDRHQGRLHPARARTNGRTCGRPEYLRQQCEGSLRPARRGADRPVPAAPGRSRRCPPRSSSALLKDLRDEGKVAEVGLSEVGVGPIEAARRIVPVVSVQNQYNIAQRSADDVLDYCEQHQIGFIPWFPLGQRQAVQTGRAARQGGRGAGRHRLPGVPGLAAPPLAGDAPDPRHLVARPSRGELRRRRPHPVRRPVRRADRGPQAAAPVGAEPADRTRDEAMTADLVIRNGALVDGTGGPLRRADVAIEGRPDHRGRRRRRPGSARARRRRAAGHPGFRRSPHPLRRPGHLGPAVGAVRRTTG